MSRFMLFVMSDADAPAGGPPPVELVEKMNVFNEEMVRARLAWVAPISRRIASRQTG